LTPSQVRYRTAPHPVFKNKPKKEFLFIESKNNKINN
jgi:hypothetical protein